MTRRNARVLVLASSCLTVVPLLGCVFAADLFNPEMVGGLGIDLRSLTGQDGFVVIAYTNQTAQVAQFQVHVPDDPANFASGIVELGAEVGPGASSSEAVRCPARLVGLGGITEAFASDNIGAIVAAAGGEATAVNVTYEATPLREGFDYTCGDVIEIQLFQRAGGGQDAQAQYGFRIRVIPGR